MSGISIDLERETMVSLLRKLSLGRLNKEDSERLIPLLNKELSKANSIGNLDHADRLERLISKLSLYVKGKIDLMPSNLDDVKISNYE